jgi:uncharacterized membrane protein
MDSNTLMQAVDNPAIDRVAEPLSKAVRGAYEAAGPAGQRARNALHGVWLGHPLHPVFTNVPVGAWTTALAMDAAAQGDPGMRRAATFAIGVGLVGAVGAAVTGLTDWSETDGQSRRVGLLHGLLNVTATALFTTSYVERWLDRVSVVRVRIRSERWSRPQWSGNAQPTVSRGARAGRPDRGQGRACARRRRRSVNARRHPCAPPVRCDRRDEQHTAEPRPGSRHSAVNPAFP